ncbi:methyl-accepting chemotaxis protein [Gallaecimonas mangrovi]|uniref:methyl-accepting chemotaxis protein n=1 Tax=Gallaecimonas mangrovi TaxID=2291597 RepID=UPI000E20571B|nr:methyl-accepting chemotaxis protein [Gallaecimonas mangrovi]
MQRILARLRFVHAVLIVSLVPLLGLIALWVVHFGGLATEAKAAAAAVDMVELVETSANLAQQGAMERGLSAGFLGSKGARFSEELKAQRQQLDEAINRFKKLPTGHLDAASKKLLAGINEQLAALSLTRQKVDALASDNGAFGFYSRLNDLALSLSTHQSLRLAGLPQLKALLDATLSLMWTSENAGQIRGLLNGAFARHQLSDNAFVGVVRAVTEEQNHIEHFLEVAPDDLKQRLNDAKQGSNWQQVKQIQQQVLEKGPSNNLADPSQGQWFDMATARIKAIKTVSGAINQRFITTAQQVSQNAQWGLWLTGLISVLVLLPLLYLIFTLTRSLKKRVAYVDETLKAITQNSDLTLRLADQRADEFGNISRSIDLHLDEVSGIFKGFHQTAVSASGAMGNIMASASQANDNAERQNQQAEHLAHAMHEIAQASSEVSGNMQQARDSMNHAKEQVSQSQLLTQAVNRGFEELTASITENRGEIERLAQHSSEISGILDTITGIAEQTNLLALNAAIEAARAGEQGRGFAVVADEVRSLAYKTRESTESVRGMIDRLQQSSASALSAMQRNEEQVTDTAGRVMASSSAVAEVTTEIDKVQDLVQQVAAAAEQQSATLAEVQEASAGINQLSQDTSEQVRAVNLEAQSLKDRLQSLEKRLAGFRMA